MKLAVPRSLLVGTLRNVTVEDIIFFVDRTVDSRVSCTEMTITLVELEAKERYDVIISRD